MRGTVSCTGRDFCQYSLIDTKGAAVAFARRMEELLPQEAATRVHWSGCQRGCGQHHIGDIGFQASRRRVGEQLVDAVDVYVGGRLGPNPQLATRVLEAVPLAELPYRVAELLAKKA